MNSTVPLLPTDAGPEEILRAGIEAAHGPVSLACSFSVEDLVIIDLIQGAGLPHLRVVMTSRILRVSWKYEKIAYRLVLQDLGCLYQTLSLAATALGLASCILGAVDARRLGAIMQLEPLVEPVIGEMTLSSR